MSLVYPKFTGTTSEELRESRFPAWIGGILDGLPPIPPLPWLGGVEVLLPTHGIAMVASRISALVGTAFSAVTIIFSNRDTIATGEPGVEVEDEEPQI